MYVTQTNSFASKKCRQQKWNPIGQITESKTMNRTQDTLVLVTC